MFLGAMYVAISMLLPLMHPKEYLSFQDDSVYFLMTPRELKRIKGKPFKYVRKDGLSGRTWYYFTEDLYGHEAMGIYRFYRSFFGKQLIHANIVINDIELEDAKDLYEKVVQSLVDYYSTQKHYYYNDDYDSDAEFSCSLGIKSENDPSWTSFYVNYKDGDFSVSADY